MVLHRFINPELEVAAFGDPQSIRNCLRNLGAENIVHLIISFVVKLLMVHHRHAVGIVKLTAGRDAEQHVLRAGMFLADVVNIVCRDQRQFEFSGEFDQLTVDQFLFLNAVVLHFQIEILLAENIQILGQDFAGFLFSAVEKRARDFSLNTGGKRNQPFTVRRKELFVGPRFVIESAQLGIGYDFTEIDVSRLVCCKQNQMIAADMRNRWIVHKFARRSNVDFASDDRFDSGGSHFFVKFNRAAHDTVVGHGACGSFVFQTHFHKVAFQFARFLVLDPGRPRNGGCSVKQTVIRMNMQVDKLFVRRGNRLIRHDNPSQ